jgi:hypothetical protein
MIEEAGAQAPESFDQSKPHTSCRDCVFAMREHKTQTGCEMGRTDIWRQQGCLVEVFNGADEFFVVSGRGCSAYVSEASAWAKKTPPEDRARAARALLRERAGSAIVLVKSGDLAALKATAFGLATQTAPPFQTFFVNRQRDVPSRDVHLALRDSIGATITWRMLEVYEVDDDLAAIDEAVGHVKASTYSVWRDGCAIPPNFYENLYKLLEEDLTDFAVIEPGFTVSTAFHKLVSGNARLEGPGAGPLDGKRTVLEKARALGAPVLEEGALCG